jgi:hypothetical protein
VGKKGKKKRGSNSPKTKFANIVSPEFKRRMEKTHENAIDLSGAPDELRLSDKLLTLIRPYMESMDTVLLADCATIAWNECLDEDFGIKGSYSLNNELLNFDKKRDLIDMLKFRKRLLFKNNRRYIVEVKIYQKGDEISVNVASDIDLQDAFDDMFAETDDELYETYSEADDEELDAALETYEDDGDISTPNLRLKRILLGIVDNQLRNNDPPITRETFERLQAEGYDAKQAKEKIAAVLAEEIYNILATQKPHDDARYEQQLRALK